MDLFTQLGAIYFSAGMWRELSLIGHWVGEAILVPWARLSSSFTGGNVSFSDILALLMTSPQQDRMVGEARDLYARTAHLVCVWSGRTLSSNSFEVDHVIPYSLWHTNDLWNLMPASRSVNRDKRDKLITRAGLDARKECIIGYWEEAYREYPDRFSSELSVRLLGGKFSRENWKSSAYASLVEAVETTAAQRGIVRWNLPEGKGCC